MKRPTRVPASSTVRMKSASNMIAKWYQMPSSRSPPIEPLKMWAMPTASDGAPGLLRRRADDPGGAVDREVDAGLERAGRDHRHHADERLHQHRAVADEARAARGGERLGGGAGGDERVEAGEGAAGDGDEEEGEERAREDRAAAVDEAGERRHVQRRPHQ